MSVLTNDMIRAYIADSAANNHLLDGLEFTDSRIDLARMLAVDSFNVIPPEAIATNEKSMPKSLMLMGVLWHLYNGQIALAARNQMSYSDGGLTIPIEERYQFYVQMAQMYEQQFKQMSKDIKISRNMESAWGSIPSDYSTFPVW